MGVIRRCIIGTAYLLAALGLFVLIAQGLDAAYPPAEAVAVCPKVEYRVKPSKSRRTIRIDTVTAIPPECR